MGDKVYAKPGIAGRLRPYARGCGSHIRMAENRGFYRFQFYTITSHFHLVIGSPENHNGSIIPAHGDVSCAIQEEILERLDSYKALGSLLRSPAVSFSKSQSSEKQFPMDPDRGRLAMCI
jgi:hypothetical protein